MRGDEEEERGKPGTLVGMKTEEDLEMPTTTGRGMIEGGDAQAVQSIIIQDADAITIAKSDPQSAHEAPLTPHRHTARNLLEVSLPP